MRGDDLNIQKAEFGNAVSLLSYIGRQGDYRKVGRVQGDKSKAPLPIPGNEESDTNSLWTRQLLDRLELFRFLNMTIQICPRLLGKDAIVVKEIASRIRK